MTLGKKILDGSSSLEMQQLMGNIGELYNSVKDDGLMKEHGFKIPPFKNFGEVFKSIPFGGKSN